MKTILFFTYLGFLAGLVYVFARRRLDAAEVLRKSFEDIFSRWMPKESANDWAEEFHKRSHRGRN